MKIESGTPAQPSSTRHWQAHIKALSKSGLSRAEYCRRQKLSYHAFVYWQRKLGNKESQDVKLVPIALPTVFAAAAGNRAGDAGLKILLPGDIAVAVAENFSSAALVKLLNILGQR